MPALSVDDSEQQGHKPCGICDMPHGAASCILYIRNSFVLGLALAVETAQAWVFYKDQYVYCDILLTVVRGIS